MVLKRKAAGSSSDRSPANQDDKLNITESQVVAAGGSPSKPQKRQRQKASVKPKEEIVWPEYFRSLFKIFKAINTVLAFVSSKRQLATSFSAVRSSVEGLLKHPLEIAKVSELKALLPDLIKFGYIPITELQLHEESKKSNAQSVDYSNALRSHTNTSDQDAQILVLDFVDNLHGKKSGVMQTIYGPPPTLSPAAVKKLIESRNAKFEQAIEGLLTATSPGDDPVKLLMTAGQNHVPVNQSLANTIEDSKDIPPSNERSSIEQIVSEIKESIWYKDQIVDQRTVEAKEAKTALLQPPVSQMISDAVLSSRNIQSLYSHQVSAIQAIREGKHVVVSTSTASGKSIIYQIPLLTFLEENRDSTAMLVFPTKALAQDQKASLEQLFRLCPSLSHLKVATYDGDTPRENRAEIRDTASVILTNFDTMHASILPNEELWRGFLKRMKILAVDELHYYTGMFGSHVVQILRRLRRVCAAIGNRRILFVSCSATLANPAEYMAKMFSLDATELAVVSNDGAPSGSKEYLVWNPPLIDPFDPSMGRYSSLSEATRIMRFLMKKGVRVILFCKIRKVCELAMKTIKADLSNDGRQDILERVRSYRGGYTREDRRKIEHEAFSGQLLGIIATNALELGIDIGVLDAVIMLGFPITISNFRQQAGRAGRRSRDSLAIMVADPFPIDQHFVAHPEELYEDSTDDLILDVDNEVILEAHLQCAGYEVPLSPEDEKWFGPSMLRICDKRLKKDADGWYHTHPNFLPFPSTYVSIRGAQEEVYLVVEIKKDQQGESAYMLEQVEFSRALFELYEGGVFMHQGSSFIVKEVNHDEKIAKVVRTDVNYITSPRDLTRIEPLQTFHIREVKSVHVNFGRIKVIVKVFGFFKIRGKAILDAVELITPPWERESTGFWIDLPQSVLDSLRLHDIDGAGAIHAAEHAFLNQFRLSQDVKTDCRVAKEEYKNIDSQVNRYPRLIFYDAAGKTGGIAARAFDHVHDLLNKAYTAVKQCACDEGCKLCVQSTACKDSNKVSSKLGARIILKALVDPDSGPLEAIKKTLSNDPVIEQSPSTLKSAQ